MTDLWQRLKQRKIVQWAIAYVAGAFALLQGIDIVAQQFRWPEGVQRGITLALVLGFFVTLLLAWYHGEQGRQRVSGTELLILALVLAVGGGVLWRYAAVPASQAPSLATQQPVSRPAPSNAIAVLPFVDMSPAHDQQYFSDGLSDELLNMLAQLPQLRVIARTSSFSFKGRNVDIATIAGKLGVAHVLEGSVRKSGDTLRISAQLVRASDSAQVWSQTYQRKLTDVFKVQDEIAASVVAALKLKLLPNQQLSNPYRSDNPEAYNQYLLGKEFFNRDTPADWRKAAAAFRRAIALEPDYGAPRAGLADAEYVLADLSGDAVKKQHALDVAEQAVARAPGLADAYAARGTIRLSFFRDWQGAGEDFDKALQLQPSSAAVQLGSYRLAMALGRHQAALASARKATASDPLNSIAWSSLGRIELVLGNADGARQAAERAQVISPDSLLAGAGVGMAALAQGKPQDALAAFRTAGDVYRLAGIAMAEHSLGHARQSQQALDEAIKQYGVAGAYQIAQAWAWRGDTDKAFAWLDKAFAHDDGGLSFLKSDPVMAKLAKDPRYATLLKKMGLPQ